MLLPPVTSGARSPSLPADLESFRVHSGWMHERHQGCTLGISHFVCLLVTEAYRIYLGPFDILEDRYCNFD